VLAVLSNKVNENGILFTRPGALHPLWWSKSLNGFVSRTLKFRVRCLWINVKAGNHPNEYNRTGHHLAPRRNRWFKRDFSAIFAMWPGFIRYFAQF
jgi:hypothetical protein